jgi:hypothetical protein
MSQAFYLFAISIGIAAILAAISIWSARPLWAKVCALGVAALFLPVSYISLVELLSQPKPISLEWKQRDLTKADVLGMDLREGQGIYLWLRMPGIQEPRSYVLPWDQELAKQLYSAQRAAEENGTGVQVKRPFTRSLDQDRPVFYALPQPPRPPKDIPIAAPFDYQQPAALR